MALSDSLGPPPDARGSASGVGWPDGRTGSERQTAAPEDPLEQRGLPRVGVGHAVRLHSQQFCAPLAGHLRDLGLGGACIATASPFALSGLTLLEIDLPGGVLDVACRGEWQCDEPGGGGLLTGLVFEGLDGRAEEQLLGLVLDRGRELARFFLEQRCVGGLGLEEAMGLAQLTRLRQLEAGEALFRQGQRRAGQDSAFFVTSGTIALQVRVRDAIEVDVARCQRGALIGGLPLLTELPPGESAVALCASQLLEIDRSSFEYLRRTRPWLGHRLGAAILSACAHRVQETLRSASERF